MWFMWWWVYVVIPFVDYNLVIEQDPCDLLSDFTSLHLLTFVKELIIQGNNKYREKVKWSCSVMSDSLRPHGL